MGTMSMPARASAARARPQPLQQPLSPAAPTSVIPRSQSGPKSSAGASDACTVRCSHVMLPGRNVGQSFTSAGLCLCRDSGEPELRPPEQLVPAPEIRILPAHGPSELPGARDPIHHPRGCSLGRRDARARMQRLPLRLLCLVNKTFPALRHMHSCAVMVSCPAALKMKGA